MSQRYFGTDGIRGVFGQPPLDEATVRTLGTCLGEHLGSGTTLVLGGDTRDSTSILARWLAAGLHARDVNVCFLGTVPTPCVAYVTRTLSAAAGISVSASHNPHPDNGIKLIASDGFKWSSADEAALEDALRARAGTIETADLPELEVDDRAVAGYFDYLATQLPGTQPLSGMKIALDAANGAAAPVAEALFRRLGAEPILHGVTPDGSNINRDCGSTHPNAMADLTRNMECDIGCAFDGDADRVIVADATGRIHDGDAMLYLWARQLDNEQQLPQSTIVATSMSNLGLQVALERHGIHLQRCGVGDREVVATLRREGLRLGGEQSGHLVDLERSTTGDGLLTALVMAHAIRQFDRPLAQLLEGFRRFPQTLINVRVATKPDLATLPEVVDVCHEIEAELGEQGRLVLRYSGTEPLARVMLEGPEQEHIERLGHRLADTIRDALGE
ncbi:MAG: phosphoglucosamine mutase [Acidobacteriota bacterium]